MNGERLEQARKIRGFSQEVLASMVGVSRMAISKYENNQMNPDSSVLVKLLDALDISLDYLFRSVDSNLFVTAYRKHAKLSKWDSEAIGFEIQDYLERYDEVEGIFDLGEQEERKIPSFNIQSLEGVEAAANELRELWKLGEDPIENIVFLLENKGIRVYLIRGYEHFDGCSFQFGASLGVAINADRSWDRQRFDLCHELGHIVLTPVEGLDEEKMAHRFAGAFLIPESCVRSNLGEQRKRIEIRELMILKNIYGLSMQAIMVRAKDLDIISDQGYRNFWRILNGKGWKINEPSLQEYQPKLPQKMQQLVYRALAEQLITRSRVNELVDAYSISEDMA